MSNAYLSVERVVLPKIFFFITILGIVTTANAQNIDSTFKDFQKRIVKAKDDTTHISLLLQLGQFYSDQAPVYQDRALLADQEALLLSKKYHLIEYQNKALIELAVQFGILQNFKESRQSYMTVINYWHDHHDLKKVISVLDFLQFRFRWGPNRNVGMLNETIRCLQQERAIYVELGDKLNAAFCLKNEGDANLNMGKLDVAENQLLQVLSELKVLHYKKLRDTYYLLAAVSHLKGNLNKQLYYCIETVKEAETERDTAMLGLFYNKLAKVYADVGMYDKSLFFFRKVMFDGYFKNDPYLSYSLCYGICKDLINQHKPLEALNFLQKETPKIHPRKPIEKIALFRSFAICYIALEKNHLAEYYLLKMINMPDYNLGLASTNYAQHFLDYMQICDFYIRTKNYIKADEYIKKTLSVSQFSVSAAENGYLHLLQFKVDSASGNYISAIKHFEIHKRLTDSIFNVKNSNQIADIQTKYETEKKDKDILLLKKQSLIEQEKYKSRRTVGNLLIAGVILLIVLLTVLYSRYLLKQRNIVLLQEKQKEISGKNQTLEKLLHENEWLLKEVHHRVKNNLHIVTSLLHSQSAYLKDEAALTAVLDSQHRVNAMSLIHQKLYKSANFTNIYIPEYIGELVDYLKDSFKTGLRILFNLEIEPLMLDVIYAIPVGLILNEAITNAVKYAFPLSENNCITIKLAQTNTDNIQLSISDNGRGLPDTFDIALDDSFGITLIKGLIDDLSGSFSIVSNHGTTIVINFSVAQRNEQIVNIE